MKLSRRRRGARVEMMPLLDIVFLVLVFFVYAMLTMSVDKAVRLNLPESSSAQPVKLEALSLSITEDGSMYLDKALVTKAGLVKALQAYVVNNGRPPSIKVYADGGLGYQALYGVLDLLNESGVKEIALQAISSGAGRSAASDSETHGSVGVGERR